MWNSIQNGPYVRSMIPDPDGYVNINGIVKQILESLSKMIEGNKKQYIADLISSSTLIAHSNASSSQSHANSSYSPQPYYVTHPSSVVVYKDEHQGELQGGSQKDKLITAMLLLARAITQKFSTSTNNRLRTLSNTRNQAMIQDGRVDIQIKNTGYGGNARAITQKFSTSTNNRLRTLSNTRNQAMIQDGRVDIQIKNTGYGGNGNKNARRQSRNQAFNARNGNNDRNQIIQRVLRTDLTPGKTNVQCYNSNGNDETVPSYDAKAVREVNASSKIHEQMHHEKRKTIIQRSNDDQIDSNIIFDDPYVEHNSGTSDHDSNNHDEYHKSQMLAYDVQREVENQKRLNNELKKQNMFLQKELETCKDRVKLFE
nr:hypothetical protein [Tanacetum cinerariifolium]